MISLHGQAARLLALAAIAVCAVLSDSSFGQEPPTGTPPRPVAQAVPAPAKSPAAPATPSSQSNSAAAVGELPGEVKPELFFLKDKEGNLQAVPGFTFESFIELYKLKHRLDQQEQKPHYTVHRMDISGIVRGDRAELVITLNLTLRDTQWIRLPLRLAGAVLQKPPDYSGSGEHLVHYDGDREGYVCWLRGGPSEKQVLTLRVLAPLTHVAGETRLKLSVPRATVSQMKVSLPVEHAVARIVDGGELQDPVYPGKNKTDLTVLGVGGEFTLAWRAASGTVAAVPIVLEAMGTLATRIDGRSVNTEARVTVRSFGGQFDGFRLRLPPEAELVGAAQAGITVTPVVGEPPAGPEGTAGKIVEIKLERKTTGPVEVKLVTERPYNIAEAGESLELAGFEVIGAVRQWGHIAVEVVGNWQVVWGPRASVRQVDELPEILRREELTAGFEYFVQPCSLTARVVPQKTRVSVDPEYVLLVGSQRVQLRAKFKYKVRGAKVRSLEMELPGWEVDDAGPASLVNPDAVLDSKEANFAIPLSQPTSGDFELTLEAHRDIAKDANHLDLEIPRPVAEASGQATVVVVPADNVELNPQTDKQGGMVAQSLKPAMKLPDRQQDPLIFRCESGSAHLVTGFKVHAKSISVEAIGQADVGEQETQVEQRLIYQIAYEPVEKLTLVMPRTVPLDKLQVTLDGARLATTVLPDDGDAEGAPVTVRVALPGPRIGRCELHVGFMLTQERLLPATSVPIALPLLMPADGRLTYNQLVVAARPGLTVSLRKGQWTVEERPRYQAVQLGDMVLTSRQSANEALLAVTLKDRQSESSTVVERGWIQTWLADDVRQERAIYRFTTSAPVLHVGLPAGVVVADLEVRIDNKLLASPEIDREGELAVRLPATPTPRQHLLQLRYHFAPREWGAHATFAAAQFKPAVWVRRMYWQLILPPQEHLLFSPDEYTREYYWKWARLGYRRQPTLEQADLETWIGATAGDVPAAETNRYLFSSLGPQENLTIWTARRSGLVFAASLALLVGGLTLIYVPAARHPGVLFTAAVVLIAGAVIEPEGALLMAQAAALGLVLALLAAALARRVNRRTTPPVAVIRSPSSIMDRSITQSVQRAARSGVPASTATAPAAMHLASPEAKP